MKNTLVVVADLACFKAFKLENNHLHRTPHLELLERFESPAAHERLVEKVTDMAGQYRRGVSFGQSTISDGERHNLELEDRKRHIRQLAQRLNQVAKNKDFERCLFAASKEINHQLLDELDPQVRAKIEKNVQADLTKVQQAELLQHF